MVRAWGRPADDLLLAAANTGDVPSWETGRYIVTFKEGATEAGIQELQGGGLSVANADDVEYVGPSVLADTDALVFREIGVAVLAGDPAQAHDMTAQSDVASDSAIEVIEAELFVFADSGLEGYLQGGYAAAADGGLSEYLRGFVRAATAIREDLVGGALPTSPAEEPAASGCDVGADRLPGAAQHAVRCRDQGRRARHRLGPRASRLRRPARFGGQKSFVVGQQVQDLHSHGTHCIGTACGPKSPAGSTPRYGIAYRASIFVGKVLSNSGSGTQAQVLAGMNWAIAKGCQVISMSLGSPAPVHAAYTAAGQAALNNGCLIIAAAGNSAPKPTGAPANSPTIMSVASLDKDLRRPRSPRLRQDRDCRAGPRRLLVGADAGPVRHEERNEHGHPARRRLRGAVGADVAQPAGHEPVAKTPGDGPTVAAPGDAGGGGARPGTMIVRPG